MKDYSRRKALFILPLGLLGLFHPMGQNQPKPFGGTTTINANRVQNCMFDGPVTVNFDKPGGLFANNVAYGGGQSPAFSIRGTK